MKQLTVTVSEGFLQLRFGGLNFGRAYFIIFLGGRGGVGACQTFIVFLVTFDATRCSLCYPILWFIFFILRGEKLNYKMVAMDDF